MSTNWVILTGEYPPQPGGVADYTRLVGHALADAGDTVEVWAPPCDGPATDGHVTVHRLPDHFGRRGRRPLSNRLANDDPNRIVLVQYVPHAFGLKAMNVPFCRWLLSLRPRRVWTMFHEVTFPFERGQPLRHRFLATVNHAMARTVARASSRAIVSIPAWGKLIEPMVRPGTPIDWCPVPSNLPLATSPAQRNGRPIVAHFGTYGGIGAPVLRETILLILRDAPACTVWLLGRGSEAFAQSLANQAPDVAQRITATGSLPPGDVANRLASADLIVQPYPDGASTRRSSLMAALAIGRPVVTTEGHLSEPIWRQTGAVALAPAGDARHLAAQAVRLLTNEPGRIETAAKGKALYDARFDLRHTIQFLRRAAQEASP